MGRIFVFTLYPLSFAEFLRFVQPNLVKFLKSPECPGLEIVRRINSFYNRYVVFGGYPRIALAKNDEERKLVLKNKRVVGDVGAFAALIANILQKKRCGHGS